MQLILLFGSLIAFIPHSESPGGNSLVLKESQGQNGSEAKKVFSSFYLGNLWSTGRGETWALEVARKRIHWKDDKPSRESVFYKNFWVVLNETGKRVCGGFLSWLFYSVLLAPNTEGNPKTLGSCPWCCPPFRVGDHFRKQLFLNDQYPSVHFYADTP